MNKQSKDGLRPELKEFAKAMEAKLKKNDYKPHWEHELVEHLLERLEEEVKELEQALWEDGGNVASEAVDVANFVMMIYSKVKHE